jgi:hypothetical protein
MTKIKGLGMKKVPEITIVIDEEKRKGICKHCGADCEEKQFTMIEKREKGKDRYRRLVTGVPIPALCKRCSTMFKQKEEYLIRDITLKCKKYYEEEFHKVGISV